MRVNAHILLVGACLTASTSCAPAVNNNTVYERWDSQLQAGAHGRGEVHSVNDVSLLLGTPPIRCDTVVGPTKGLGVIALGIGADPSGNVDWIAPGSVADLAGVPLHGKIIGANGQRIHVTVTDTTKDGIRTSTLVGPNVVVDVGVPVTLNLADSQNITLTLRSAQWLQCYWRAGAGRVAEANAKYGGSAAADLFGASGSTAGSASALAYDKFFTASARFVNGVMTVVKANWQGR